MCTERYVRNICTARLLGCVWGERGLYDSRTLRGKELGGSLVDTASCIIGTVL